MKKNCDMIEENVKWIVIMKYDALDCNDFYIDKTKQLEDALEKFPYIYIEGAAACGKTTAVKMLLHKLHAVDFYDGDSTAPAVFLFDGAVEYTNVQDLSDTLQTIKEKLLQRSGTCFFVFENLQVLQDDNAYEVLVSFLRSIKGRGHGICISREEPPKGFLDFIWKREMECFGMAEWMLTKREVAAMIEQENSRLNVEELYEITGGWVGCVHMMIRLHKKLSYSVWQNKEEFCTAKELRKEYEIDTYIRENLLNTLSPEEKMLLSRSQLCSWLNESLCRELWGIQDSEVIFKKLVRKGFLVYNAFHKHWSAAPLFRRPVQAEDDFWLQLGSWYEENGYIYEALISYARRNDLEMYKDCMIRNAKKIPYSGIDYSEVMRWKEPIPELIYLRGMYSYYIQDKKTFENESHCFKEQIFSSADTFPNKERIYELYLNLQYLNAEVSLNEWLELAKEYHESTDHRFSIYRATGYSMSALCGLRDLTELFAETKKEENRKMRIWKECLDEDANKLYQLAKLEYYIETNRTELITSEEREFLVQENSLPAVSLLMRFEQEILDEKGNEQIRKNVRALSSDCKEPVSVIVEFLRDILEQDEKISSRIVSWMRYIENMKLETNEDTYSIKRILVQCYMQYRQYDKAKKVLNELIPYLIPYGRWYYLAEHHFQMAVIYKKEGRSGYALQHMIESFLISRQYRYVGFYAQYGKNGIDALENYIQWMQANEPERWHRKKKYKYGNVLRMPEADYMDVILRLSRRKTKGKREQKEDVYKEHLTMMENVILHCISRGLTNQQICEELNLKLPTVKTHLYSLYKKLGVNTRVQAIVTGKEKGLLNE